jgi:hypothetical protein
MKRTPGLWHIILVLALIVMYIRPVEQSMKIWDKRLGRRGALNSAATQGGTGSGGPGGWRGSNGDDHRLGRRDDGDSTSRS